MPQPVSDVATWEKIFFREHLKHCLAAIRDEFNNKTLEAFKRYFLNEQPAAKVCVALDMSINSVYLAKFRVLRRLKERMTELVGYEV